MQKDWLKDLLEWSPLFLVLLAGGALWLYSKWQLRKVDRSLKELWGMHIRKAESGDAYSQFQAGRMYQKGRRFRDAVLAG